MFRPVSIELDPAVSDRVPNIADRLEEFRTKYNIEVEKSQGKNYSVRGNLDQLRCVEEALLSLQEDVEQAAPETSDEYNSKQLDTLDDQNLNIPISSHSAEEEKDREEQNSLIMKEREEKLKEKGAEKSEGLKKYNGSSSLLHEHVQTPLNEDDLYDSREDSLNVIRTPNAINKVQDIEQPPPQNQEDDTDISQSCSHQEQPEKEEGGFLDNIPSDDEQDALIGHSVSPDSLTATNSKQDKGGDILDNGEIAIEAEELNLGKASGINDVSARIVSDAHYNDMNGGVQSVVINDKSNASKNGKLSKTASAKSGLNAHVDDVMLSPTESYSDEFLSPFDDDSNDQKEDGDLVNIKDEQPVTEIKNSRQDNNSFLFIDNAVTNLPSEHSSVLANEDQLSKGIKPTDTSTNPSTNYLGEIDRANQEENNALNIVSNKGPDKSTAILPEPKEKNSYSIYGDENWDEDDEDDVDNIDNVDDDVYAKDDSITRGTLAKVHEGPRSAEELDAEHVIKQVQNVQFDQGISPKEDGINTEQFERAASPEAGNYPLNESDTTEIKTMKDELTENLLVDTFLMEFIKDYHSDKLDRIQTQFGVDFDFMVEGECTEIRFCPADGRDASPLSLANARATLAALYEGVMESIIKRNIEYDPNNINKESMEYTIQSIVMSLGMDHPVKICDDGHGIVVVIGSQSDATDAANQLMQNLSMEHGEARRIRTEFQMSSAMNKLVMVMQGKDTSRGVAEPSASLTLIEENTDSEAKPTIASLSPVPLPENAHFVSSEDATANLTGGTTMGVSVTETQQHSLSEEITAPHVSETYRKMETEEIAKPQLEDNACGEKLPDYGQNHNETYPQKIDKTKTEQRTEKENIMYDPFSLPDLHHSKDTTDRDRVVNNTMHGVSEMKQPWENTNKGEPQVPSNSQPFTEQKTLPGRISQNTLQHSSKTAAPTIRFDKTDNNTARSSDRENLNEKQKSESLSTVKKTQTYHFSIGDDIRLTIAVDNIAKVHCDAMIIPATQLLTHVGNLGMAISESAGEEFSDACDKKMEKDGELKLCDVAITTGGKLQCQDVIHVVAPTWTEHRDVLCTSKLQQTLLNAFNCANNELHARCVALPPLGTGYYMYPVDTFMGELFKTLYTLSQTRTVKYIEDVKLVDLSQTTVNIMAEIFMELEEFEKQTAETIANTMPVTTYSRETTENHENISKIFSTVHGSSDQNPALEMSSSQRKIHTIQTGATTVPSPETNQGPPSSGITGLTQQELNNSRHSDATAEMVSEPVIDLDMEIPAPVGTEHGRSPTTSKTNEEHDDQINKEIFSNISNLLTGRSAHYSNFSSSDSGTHKTTESDQSLRTEVNAHTSQSADLYNHGKDNGRLTNGELGESHDTKSPTTADTRAESPSMDDRLVPDKMTHQITNAVDSTPTKKDSNTIIQQQLYYNRHNEDGDNKSTVVASSDSPSGITEKLSGKTSCVTPSDAAADISPDVNDSEQPENLPTQENNANGTSRTEDTRNESLLSDFDEDKARSMIGQHQSGRMTWEIDRKIILPGHQDTPGAIVITYKIPKGNIKGVDGDADIAYKGGSGKAYLPNSAEGRSTVQHLKLAFEAGLTFTVDIDSGRIKWSDIPHKLRIDGGPEKQGYPDPGYIDRLRQVLKEKKLICFE